MAKSTFTAIDPNGATHKRTSVSRTYTHTVCSKPNYEYELKHASEPRIQDGINWGFSCQMVAWGGLYKGERKSWDTDSYVAQQLARYTELKNEYSSREAAIEGERQKRIAAVEARMTSGHYRKYECHGWCGRLDLAQKLAAQTAPHRLDVTILPAVRR